MSLCIMELISINYENTKYLIDQFVLQEYENFSWRVSDLWKISGVFTGGDGVFWKCFNLLVEPPLMRHSMIVSASTESVFQTCRFLYHFD